MFNMKPNRGIFLAMTAIAALAISGATHATFIGTTIDGGILSAGGGVPDCATTGPRVVGAGIEYTCQNSALQWDLDVGVNTIDLWVTNTGLPGLNVGNTTVISLTDLFWEGSASGIITGVSGPSSATFTDHTFDVTVFGATPDFDHYQWTITAENSAVFEPTTFGLLVLGLAGMVFARASGR